MSDSPKFPASLVGVATFELTMDLSLIANDQGPKQYRSESDSPVGFANVRWKFLEGKYATFRSFYKEILLNGHRWFELPIPSETGITKYIVKFTEAGYRAQHLGFDAMDVTATVEIRGLPEDVISCACASRPRLDLTTIVPGEPIVYGVGGRSIMDDSGYVWTTYAHSSGLQLHRYNPLTQADDIEPIEVVGENVITNQINLAYFNCNLYISMEGNSYTVGHDVLYKYNACSSEFVGSGDTDYVGAVSKLGLVSHNDSQLFLSVTNGIGDGTIPISEDPPFVRGGGSSNSDWLFNFVYNPTSRVRAYTGYGAFVDFRDGGLTSVSTVGYINQAHLQETRMLVRQGTNQIFLMNCRTKGVISIDTVTGAIGAFIGMGSPDPYPFAFYYSPDTDTLYVECADNAVGTLVNRRTLAFDASTRALKASYPLDVISLGGFTGDTIYIGNETFVGSETSVDNDGVLWQISFGWR